MLGVGDTLTHPGSGERLTVLAHTREELVLEDLWPAGHRVPEHRHPQMSERWQLLTGRAAVTIAATEHVLTPGRAATAAEGVAHSARVLDDQPALVRMTLRPALRWLEVVERLFSEDDPAVVLRAYPEELTVP